MQSGDFPLRQTTAVHHPLSLSSLSRPSPPTSLNSPATCPPPAFTATAFSDRLLPAKSLSPTSFSNSSPNPSPPFSRYPQEIVGTLFRSSSPATSILINEPAIITRSLGLLRSFFFTQLRSSHLINRRSSFLQP
ncbi:hypothetical protein HHK36_027259 [Tetracentron sinense]|uniref:Uncharacterized protein n=1 Tax=Tetracentron sinense TaxID=13715 RepID=A0A834YMC0_TETSI|nr:hypothetical protein HHK36_027259 [Tetracentron sinense]